MNARTLAILAALTALIAAGALFVTMRGDGARPAAAATPAAFATVTERINDVAAIIVRKGGAGVVLKRAAATDGGKAESTWTVASSGGYPAKFDQVKASLMSVVDIEDPQPKTADPALHERIGVEDPGPATDSTMVTLRDADEKTIAAFIVGDSTFVGNAQATYVRLAESPQSWLVEKRIDFPVEPTRWMDTEIVRLDRDRVKAATIAHPDGHTLHLTRQTKDQQNFDVADLPEGRELTSPSIGVPPASALSFFSFENVRPAAEGAIPADAVTAEYETFDGLTIRVRTWSEPALEDAASAEPTWWAALEAVPPAPPTVPPATDPGDTDPADTATGPLADPGSADEPEVGPPLVQEDGASADAESTDPAAIVAEAEELNEKFAPWHFAIGQFKADTLRKRLDDLLKPAGG